MVPVVPVCGLEDVSEVLPPAELHPEFPEVDEPEDESEGAIVLPESWESASCAPCPPART